MSRYDEAAEAAKETDAARRNLVLTLDDSGARNFEALVDAIERFVDAKVEGALVRERAR